MLCNDGQTARHTRSAPVKLPGNQFNSKVVFSVRNPPGINQVILPRHTVQKTATDQFKCKWLLTFDFAQLYSWMLSPLGVPLGGLSHGARAPGYIINTLNADIFK